MYELFCGQPMFRGRSFGEYVRKHLTEMPVPPRQTAGRRAHRPAARGADPASASRRIRPALRPHPRAARRACSTCSAASRRIRRAIGSLTGERVARRRRRRSCRHACCRCPRRRCSCRRPRSSAGDPASSAVHSAPHPSLIYSHTRSRRRRPEPARRRSWVWLVGGALAIGRRWSPARCGTRPRGLERRAGSPLRRAQPATSAAPIERRTAPQLVELRFDSLPSGGVFEDGHVRRAVPHALRVQRQPQATAARRRRTFVVQARRLPGRAWSSSISHAPSADFTVTLDAACRRPRAADGAASTTRRSASPSSRRKPASKRSQGRQGAEPTRPRQAAKTAGRQAERQEPSDPKIEPDRPRPTTATRPTTRRPRSPTTKKPGDKIDPADTLDPFRPSDHESTIPPCLASRSCCCSLFAAHASRAQTISRPGPRKRHYDRGEKLFALGKFDDALDEFQKAFDAKPIPDFLFNIGQCHRNLGDYEQAIFSFKKFLKLEPEAPNREQVQELIDELEDEAATWRREQVRASKTARRSRRVDEPRPPFYKKWWFWTGSSRSSGSPAASAIYAATRPAGPPNTDLGNIVFGK